jgi:hypothetical protein
LEVLARPWDTRGNGYHECEQRLIIVHFGSKEGFIPKAQLVYKANSATEDYYGQMNYDTFFEWITHQVILDLHPSNIIVADTVPFHSKEHRKKGQQAGYGQLVKIKWVSCYVHEENCFVTVLSSRNPETKCMT